ncbi:MAG: GtrA family protein [Roseburia sp.]|nr:GtrA family protein [Roseburia sp.]
MNGISTKLWNMIETIVRAVFGLIFEVCKIDFSEEQWESLLQFVKFGLVGVWNTVFSYAINLICLLSFRGAGLLQFEFLSTPVAVYVANIIAFIISVFVSFLLNNKFVFTLEEGQSRSFGKALFKSYLSYGFTGIILNNVLAFVWVGVCGISELVAPLISLVIAIPINFFMNKLWAFKSDNGKDE